MKKWKWLAWIVGCVMVLYGLRMLKTPSDSLYSFQAQTSQGQYFHTKNLSSSLRVVHFWATWCAPCLVELPDLIKAARQAPQVDWLLISEDEKREDISKIKEFNESLPSHLHVLYDVNSQIAKLYGSYQYPETYLLDVKENKLIKKWVGPQDWSKLIQEFAH